MGLEIFKNGFINYLQEISEISNKKYNTNNADVSIFMYANEFKNYLSDEINVDPKILSMSITDILKMEVKNGKLVDPNEDEEEIPEEETDETTKSGEIKDTETADITEKPADEGKNLEQGDLPVEGQQGLIPENIQSYGENPTINMGEVTVVDYLNTLFEEDTIKNVIDTDKNDELNAEEIETFLNAIKDYDGDDENISLEDILGAMIDILKGTFNLNPEESETVNEEIMPANETREDINTGNQSAVGGTAPTGRVSGGSGVSGPTGTSGGRTAGVTSQQGTEEKTLDNMNKEELNAELSSAQSDLSEKQSTLSAVLDGSDSAISQLEENVNQAYDTYQEQLKLVDEELAEQVDDLKSKIDEQENKIDQKEQEISDQESVVSDSETEYNNAVTTRENLETSLAALKSIDTSEMDSAKLSELNSKISELTTKVETAKRKEEEAKTRWDEAEEKLKQLKEEKEELISGQGGLDELNQQMTELEAEIIEKYPEIKEYLEAYNSAKETYDTEKQTAIANAKAEVQTAQNYVNEVQTAINNFENKETVKDYCFGEFGEDIADFAQQFIGYNESNGSADIFLYGGYTSSSTPWCAAFVEYIMKNSGSYEDLPDWYKDISNKWYCPNIDKAARDAGAIINGEEAQTGDIVLFDWDGDGTKDHVGIVKVTENGQVITIEGNTSNQVAERTYDINDSRLTFCKVVS